LAVAARRFQRRLISCLGSFGFGFDLGFYGGGSLRGSGGRLWLGFGLILVCVYVQRRLSTAATADLGVAAAAEKRRRRRRGFGS
jgi:hypothetical protein